jgi:hypothetical protein
MTNWIVALVTIVSLVSVGVAVWTLVDTRRRYYNEYVKRRGMPR